MNPAREVIYSVTLFVDQGAVSEWVTWMLETHLPEVMRTGCFEAYEMRRQVEPAIEGRTAFEVRYLCASIETYRRYQEEHAPRLQAGHTQRWKGRFEATRRLLGSMETRS